MGRHVYVYALCSNNIHVWMGVAEDGTIPVFVSVTFMHIKITMTFQ